MNLQSNMAKTLDSFVTLLQLLTDIFLLEEPLHQLSQHKLQRAVESHQSSFTSLQKNLVEARSEWFYQSSSYANRVAYGDAVDSLNRLAQHLNGLRSGTRLQYELAKAHSDGRVVLKTRPPVRNKLPGEQFFATDTHANLKRKEVEASVGDEPDNALLQVAAAMFGDLVDDLGPPLHALSVRPFCFPNSAH